MRNENLAEQSIKGFEERWGRKVTPEEEARIRELWGRIPELKPNSEGRAVGGVNRCVGQSRRPQKLAYDHEEYEKLLIQYPDARRYLPCEGPAKRNPNFKQADFIVLKKLGLK
jgi:hypothetical protein